MFDGVEVLGRYSNHSGQGKRLRRLVTIVPGTHSSINQAAKRQVHRRLTERQGAELVAAYLAGSTTYELAETFRIGRQQVGLVRV